MAQHLDTGKTGEQLAVKHLTAMGFSILHTNYRFGRNEVDIIASKQKTLHFTEVKTISAPSLALPEQRVNRAKINRMKRVAEAYLAENPGWQFVQFDIVAITLQPGLPPDIMLIEDVV